MLISANFQPLKFRTDLALYKRQAGCDRIFVLFQLIIAIARITFTNCTWASVRLLSCFLGGCNWMTLGENIWPVFFSDARIRLPCPYLQGFNASYKRHTSASKRVALGEILLNTYQLVICCVLHMHVGTYLRSC